MPDGARSGGVTPPDLAEPGRAPLFEAWVDVVRRSDRGRFVPFTIPGHKRRGAAVVPELGRLLDADVPLYGGLDTVKLTAGVLHEAEVSAARYWGADWLRFSTGGSTQANQVTTLAVGRPGDTVLVARTAHRSLLSGIALAGLRPVWLPCGVDDATGLPTGVDPPMVATALDENPSVSAMFLVEPSYVGTVSPLAEIVALCHTRDVPVVVDQAWGAHFGAHPSLPRTALQVGADAMVFSAHKTLPAFSQAAVVAARGERLDLDRWERAVAALETTSPAGAILASIDASRWILETRGEPLLDALIAAVAEVRVRFADQGIVTAAVADPSKLVLLCAPSGLDGLVLEQALLAQGLPVEQADRDTVIPLVGLLDDAATLTRLADAVLAFATTSDRTPRPVVPAAHWTLAPPPQALPPGEAFTARHETVAVADAVGRVSAELVAPYPPGIPLLVPGEQITTEVLDAVAAARAAGTRIAYAADPTFRTVQVVR
ncbi:aminotransferase class I/II-fold pyridoxal phosphate-dependent enzyme [Jatrophihabitans sp. YIM 134969]